MCNGCTVLVLQQAWIPVPMFGITFLFKFHYFLLPILLHLFLVCVFLTANLNSFNVRHTTVFQYLSVIWLYNKLSKIWFILFYLSFGKKAGGMWGFFKHKFTTGSTAMKGMETSIRNPSYSQKGQIHWGLSVAPLHPPLPCPPWLPSIYQLRHGTGTYSLIQKKELLEGSTSSECAGPCPGKICSFLNNNNITSF